MILIVFVSLGFSNDIDGLTRSYEKFSNKMSGYEYVSNTTNPKSSFLMSKCEVTNFEYLEFLYDLRQNVSTDYYNTMLLDTNQWLGYSNQGELLAEYYNSHPAYHSYPVVNVTFEQAKAYCEWVQKKLTKNDIVADYNIDVRLPTTSEWNYAASSGQYISLLPFPGESLTDTKGNLKCNYNKIKEVDISITDSMSLILNDSDKYFPYPDHITQTVYSGEKGYNSLLNLAGNVAEFVQEKGVTKGGSWADPARKMLNSESGEYSGSGKSIKNGFRVLIEIKKVD